MRNKFLTDATLAVFLDFARTCRAEERDPEVCGTSRKDKGHITNLKKAGLITTSIDDSGWNNNWVAFTDKGKALAAEHGINVFDDATGYHYEPEVA